MSSKCMSSPKANVVQARGLTKRYDKFTAIDNIDFNIIEGECFGILGPNGAGKTTTVKMIYCFSPVTSGSLTVMGKDVQTNEREIKARLGVVPQEDNLDPELTAWQNLIIYASYFGIKRAKAAEKAKELFNLFGLNDKKNTPAGNLSGG